MSLGQISEECKKNRLIAVIESGQFKGFKTEVY